MARKFRKDKNMIKNIFISFGILLFVNTAYTQTGNLRADKKVLILHSQHATFQWTGKLDRAIKEEFAGAPFNIQLYTEYMDTRRFPAKELFPQLYRIYQKKYRHLEFDLILFTDNAALNFLIRYRDGLFPHVPVVFCGLNNYTPVMIGVYKGITGILEDFDLKATIELILSIQPKIKTIGIVSDASYTGRLHRQRFLALKPSFNNLVTLRDIAGLDEKQVVREIRQMPEDSAVIVLSYHLDPRGKFFSVREGLEILQKGKRPLYSCWETSLGEGIVGGIITNARRHGRDAARMGIDILKGKKTDDIPVQSCTNLPMFDYRFIKKYKINQSLLPTNSIIINKPDSFYIRYHKTILFILCSFAIMAGLIAGLIINIMKKQQVQNELVRERNFIKTILETADVLVIVINLSGKIIIFNRACQKCTGYTVEDIQQIPFWDILFLPEDKKEIRTFIENAHKDFPREYEKYLVTKNGLQRLIHWLNSMVINRQGDIDFIICTGIDITGRKQTEEELCRYRDHLEELVQERTKELEAFAYSVSHDLRAPLRHINGFIDLLKNNTGTTLDEKGRYYMNFISNAATKMGFLIDDLLSFSRLGRQTMNLKPVELGEIVSETIKSLNPDISEKNIEWNISTLPEVYADASMLHVVLSNLVSNAVKFSRTRKQTRIEIGSHSREKEIVVFIRDNGIGFNQEYADNLFGVFQRLHRADEYEGTGVGLAIAQRIINRHNGEIWAEGEMDSGATFYFSLPQPVQRDEI